MGEMEYKEIRIMLQAQSHAGLMDAIRNVRQKCTVEGVAVVDVRLQPCGTKCEVRMQIPTANVAARKKELQQADSPLAMPPQHSVITNVRKSMEALSPRQLLQGPVAAPPKLAPIISMLNAESPVAASPPRPMFWSDGHQKKSKKNRNSMAMRASADPEATTKASAVFAKCAKLISKLSSRLPGLENARIPPVAIDDVVDPLLRMAESIIEFVNILSLDISGMKEPNKTIRGIDSIREIMFWLPVALARLTSVGTALSIQQLAIPLMEDAKRLATKLQQECKELKIAIKAASEAHKVSLQQVRAPPVQHQQQQQQQNMMMLNRQNSMENQMMKTYSIANLVQGRSLPPALQAALGQIQQQQQQQQQQQHYQSNSYASQPQFQRRNSNNNNNNSNNMMFLNNPAPLFRNIRMGKRDLPTLSI